MRGESVDKLIYDMERDAVRVLLADACERVLLFHMVTREVPDGWWELPGGGIDPGESYLEAAVKEIREETGLVVDPAHVGPPTWRPIPPGALAASGDFSMRWSCSRG